MIEQNEIKQPGFKWKRTVGEMVVIVLIITGLVAILLPAVERARNPKGPHGRMIPDAPPNELNRISDESGLSIVAPENWDRRRLPYDGRSIAVHARGAPAARIQSTIEVMPSVPPDDQFLKEARKLEFQGYPAYEKTGYEMTTFEYTTHLIYVKRGESWWQITVGIKRNLAALPEEFRPYLETIRFPENEEPSSDPVPQDDTISREH